MMVTAAASRSAVRRPATQPADGVRPIRIAVTPLPSLPSRRGWTQQVDGGTADAGSGLASMSRRLHSIAILLVALLLSRGRLLAEPCIGDCQGTGREDIASLVTLVSIALGSAPLSACPHGVPSGEAVTIAVLIQAVTNALGSCPGLPATPTLTPVVVASTPTPTATPNGSSCPVGRHRVCHSGSGRGGGYHRTCTCVAIPPPVCRTAWGTQIAAGNSIVVYDTATVTAPETCAGHAAVVSCSTDGVLTPPDATGYPVCRVIGDQGGQD
jgi:hypothetical protein